MKVVHCKRSPHTVYIGRPSIFGNPFAINGLRTREDAIEQYEVWARANPIVMAAIAKLPEDAILGCWCAPKVCHGDVIMKLWKELRMEKVNG